MTTKVERPVEMNNEELKKHLKAIAQAIAEDAEHLTIDTNSACELKIEAEIAPMEKATKIHYHIVRNADWRSQ